MKTRGAATTSGDAVPASLMTVREVSAYLQVHPSTIYRMLRHKQIPAFQVGNEWRFNIESIDQWCLKKEKARP
jgi:excisionase family DNA binding protein